ncbi:MAG: hypothetical protein H0U66_00390 [Gemmatimonadaceae bacterium]|nr:hypothetical protein [Gemmatimonadaceae bacterium]
MSALKLITLVAAFGVAVASTGCKGGSDSTVKSVDTVVTTTKVRDTTVIKADTTIHVDTVKQTHNVPGAKKP